MKQFIFLCLLTLGGGLGGLIHPFWAVLLYYILAVLRPQFLWEWALPMEVRWSLIAAVIVLLTVAVNFPRLFRRGRLNATASLMMVYGMLVMTSVVTAYDPGVAQSWAVDFVKVMLIALIATFIIEHLWQVRVVIVATAMCLGYIAYEINYLYMFQNARLDVFHYGYGGLDNNGAGLMLAMGLPLAYALAMTPGRDARLLWARRFVAVGIALVLIQAIMLTYSRGAMLAGIVGLLWLAWRHRPRRHVLVITPIVVVVLFSLAGDEIREEFLSTRQYRQDKSAQSRFESWNAAWQITWEHPVFGAGLRNSNTYSHNYGADRSGRTIHNQYLQIAADSGIPAALAYLALLGWSIVRLGAARKAALHVAAECQSTPNDDDPDSDSSAVAARQLTEAQYLCLAVQSSLIIFAFDGIFLSLETFELPWLMLVVAGVLPGVIDRRIAALRQPQQEELEDSRNRFSFPMPQPRLLENPT
ncbi:MAG: O-antigen ligase family protein [Phycisphaeraceae bacterium]|nr:O-antigen ligase family protein [Phycisphaeraceae bacterium]